MTSAQSRAIREISEALADERKKRLELLDMLLAVLSVNGGRVKVPVGAVLSARRQGIVAQQEGDDYVIRTEERAKRDAMNSTVNGVLRRVIGG